MASDFRADITSRNQRKVETHLRNFSNVLEKMEAVNERDHLRNFQPPVGGAEIMQTFALPPCETVGRIKSAIKEAVLEGVIPNEHDAAYAYMLSYAESLGISLPAQGAAPEDE